MTKSFVQLSRVTQRKYLKELAKQALSRYGIWDAEIRYITDLNNVVFRIVSGSSPYSLRIHPPNRYSNAEIEAELLWLAAIRAETDMLVPTPVLGTDGAFVQKVLIPRKNEPRQVVLFEWISGKLLGSSLTRRSVRQAGEFMARLHQHAESFLLPQGALRPHVDWNELGSWPNWGKDNIVRLSKEDYDLCQQTAKTLLVEMRKLVTKTDYGLIHGDLHPWNYVVHGDRIGGIDFDDSWHAPFVYDIATPFFFWVDHKNHEDLRDTFLNGYTAVRPLPGECALGIDLSIIYRSLCIVDWILSWTNPAEGDGLWVFNIALKRIRQRRL